MNPKQAITIIGAGRVGCTLGRLLHEAGYPLAGITCASMESARKAVAFIGSGTPCEGIPDSALLGEIIFLTPPDDRIAGLATELAAAHDIALEDHDRAFHNHVVFHCSGALASTVLAPLQLKGAAIGALHPMQSFADPEKAVQRMPGSFFCLEGDAVAIRVGRELVQRLKGRLLSLPTGEKVFSHLACVAASNFLVTLIGLGVSFLEHAEIPQEEGISALLPLIRGTLDNIEAVGIEKALTGPFARGDLETIRQHCDALRTLAPDQWSLYARLGLETIQLAEASGQLSARTAEQIRALLTQ